MIRRAALAAFVLPLLPAPALAQNTSGVPGPTVDEGLSEAAYRVVASTGDDRGTRAAHRLQYARALTGSLRWRVTGQALTSDGDARPEYLQADLLWQVTPDDQRFQTGLRLDARVQDGPRPERLGLVWTSAYAVTDALSVGASLHGTVEVGDLARDGVTIETRGVAAYAFGDDREVGVELFLDHGRTPDPEPFEGRQQAGPFVSLPVGGDWSAEASVLFGLSEETQDLDLRLFVTRGF